MCKTNALYCRGRVEMHCNVALMTIQNCVSLRSVGELYRVVRSVYLCTISDRLLRPTIANLLTALYFTIGLLCFSATSSHCFALESQLPVFLAKVPASELIPSSDHYGPLEGNPPVAKAFAGQKLVGYAFVNADWVNSTGYSGQPI